MYRKIDNLDEEQETDLNNNLTFEKTEDQNHIQNLGGSIGNLKIFHQKCEQCKKSFVSKSTLTSHFKRMHQNMKPNKCNYCGSSFLEKNELQTHITGTHFKIKPNECNYCKMPFESVD